MALIVHSGTAAIDLSQHSLAGQPPVFTGVMADGNAYYHDPDGTKYWVPPGGYAITKSGYILMHPGPTFPHKHLVTSTATIWNPGQFLVGPGAPPIPLDTTSLLEPLPIEKRDMPVIGYRAWKYAQRFILGRGHRVSLNSTGVQAAWKPGNNTAHCGGFNTSVAMLGQHEAPHERCGCGFYVLADIDEVLDHNTLCDELIVGAVLGWGRVVQHGREGWRAQHVRIVGLLDCKYSAAQLKNTDKAAEAYKVLVYGRDALERYVKEWGDPFSSA